MRYLIRKIVEAGSIREALAMDRRTDPLDIVSEQPESPSERRMADAVGFHYIQEDSGWESE